MTLHTTTKQEFWERYLVNTREHPEWRPGQCCFNTLYAVRPMLADSIRGTDLDTFYTDDQDRVAMFFEWIERIMR